MSGASDNAGKQIGRVSARADGRALTEREWELVRPFVKEHGLEALGRVIFNTSEFVQAD